MKILSHLRISRIDASPSINVMTLFSQWFFSVHRMRFAIKCNTNQMEPKRANSNEYEMKCLQGYGTMLQFQWPWHCHDQIYMQKISNERPFVLVHRFSWMIDSKNTYPNYLSYEWLITRGCECTVTSERYLWAYREPLHSGYTFTRTSANYLSTIFSWAQMAGKKTYVARTRQ